MMTTPRPPQPAVMTLIEHHRRRLGLSIRSAADRAGFSESRWRQLKDGGRLIGGVAVTEEAPDETLAHMAFAVRVAPSQLHELGYADAAQVLADLYDEQAADEAQDAEDAARMVELLSDRNLTPRVRSRLESEISIALQRARTEKDLTAG